VLFHHRTGGDLFGSFSVAPGFLSAFLDVFVLTLFFAAYSTHVLFGWHFGLLSFCQGADQSAAAMLV
jgi:hypothetical protein